MGDVVDLIFDQVREQKSNTEKKKRISAVSGVLYDDSNVSGWKSLGNQSWWRDVENTRRISSIDRLQNVLLEDTGVCQYSHVLSPGWYKHLEVSSTQQLPEKRNIHTSETHVRDDDDSGAGLMPASSVDIPHQPFRKARMHLRNDDAFKSPLCEDISDDTQKSPSAVKQKVKHKSEEHGPNYDNGDLNSSISSRSTVKVPSSSKKNTQQLYCMPFKKGHKENIERDAFDTILIPRAPDNETLTGRDVNTVPVVDTEDNTEKSSYTISHRETQQARQYRRLFGDRDVVNRSVNFEVSFTERSSIRERSDRMAEGERQLSRERLSVEIEKAPRGYKRSKEKQFKNSTHSSSEEHKISKNTQRLDTSSYSGKLLNDSLVDRRGNTVSLLLESEKVNSRKGSSCAMVTSDSETEDSDERNVEPRTGYCHPVFALRHHQQENVNEFDITSKSNLSGSNRQMVKHEDSCGSDENRKEATIFGDRHVVSKTGSMSSDTRTVSTCRINNSYPQSGLEGRNSVSAAIGTLLSDQEESPGNLCPSLLESSRKEKRRRALHDGNKSVADREKLRRRAVRTSADLLTKDAVASLGDEEMSEIDDGKHSQEAASSGSLFGKKRKEMETNEFDSRACDRRGSARDVNTDPPADTEDNTEKSSYATSHQVMQQAQRYRRPFGRQGVVNRSNDFEVSSTERKSSPEREESDTMGERMSTQNETMPERQTSDKKDQHGKRATTSALENNRFSVFPGGLKTKSLPKSNKSSLKVSAEGENVNNNKEHGRRHFPNSSDSERDDDAEEKNEHCAGYHHSFAKRLHRQEEVHEFDIIGKSRLSESRREQMHGNSFASAVDGKEAKETSQQALQHKSFGEGEVTRPGRLKMSLTERSPLKEKSHLMMEGGGGERDSWRENVGTGNEKKHTIHKVGRSSMQNSQFSVHNSSSHFSKKMHHSKDSVHESHSTHKSTAEIEHEALHNGSAMSLLRNEMIKFVSEAQKSNSEKGHSLSATSKNMNLPLNESVNKHRTTRLAEETSGNVFEKTACEISSKVQLEDNGHKSDRNTPHSVQGTVSSYKRHSHSVVAEPAVPQSKNVSRKSEITKNAEMEVGSNVSRHSERMQQDVCSTVSENPRLVSPPIEEINNFAFPFPPSARRDLNLPQTPQRNDTPLRRLVVNLKRNSLKPITEKGEVQTHSDETISSACFSVNFNPPAHSTAIFSDDNGSTNQLPIMKKCLVPIKSLSSSELDTGMGNTVKQKTIRSPSKSLRMDDESSANAGVSRVSELMATGAAMQDALKEKQTRMKIRTMEKEADNANKSYQPSPVVVTRRRGAIADCHMVVKNPNEGSFKHTAAAAAAANVSATSVGRREISSVLSVCPAIITGTVEAMKKRYKNACKISEQVKTQPKTLKDYFPVVSSMQPKITVDNKKKVTVKTVDPDLLIDGKIMKQPPKLKKPKKWVSDKLYKLIINKCEQKYGFLKSRTTAENFIVKLCETVTLVIKQKKNYSHKVDIVMKQLYRLNLIRTRHDFFVFIEDFLPQEFRDKAIPCLGRTTAPKLPPQSKLFCDLNL